MKKILIGGVVVGALGYLAAPYWTLARLVSAAQNNDAAALEAGIDFDALRSSLGQQIEVRMNRSSGEEAPSPMARMLAQGLVRSMVTPAGIGAVLRSGGRMPSLMGRPTSVPETEGDEPAAVESGSRLGDLDWIFFTSPTRFEVSARGGSMVLQLGGSGWRVVDLILPDLRRPAP